MLYFTVELFIDALILVLHYRTADVQILVNKILEIYEAETKESAYMENEFFDLYIRLIQEVLQLRVDPDNVNDVEIFLLKFKSSPLVLKDPELYTTLKRIFTDKTTLTKERYEYLMRKLTNCILWYNNTKNVKKMFGKLAGNGATASPDKQEALFSEMSELCSDLIRTNQERCFSRIEDENQARLVDFDDKDTIAKSLKVFQKTSVTNVFKTGLQGLNRAFGPSGGWRLGESIVFNALSFNGKALAHGTPVRVPGGWKLIEDIRIGDSVIARDGTVSKVTGVFPQGLRDIYRVTFGDGRVIDVDREHLWTICSNTESGRLTEDVTTEQLVHLLFSSSSDISIPLCEPEQIDDILLPTDPYELGCTKPDILPDVYLECSYKQKLALLRGLFTVVVTSANDTSAILMLKSKKLAEQIQYLVRSMGGKCTIQNQRDQCLRQVLIVEMREFHACVDDLLLVKQIESLTEQQLATCIAIDHPEKLFVTKDFIVTHNTMSLLKMARWQVTHNKVTSDFKNPTCIVYSLENETPQNTMMLFTELYINLKKETPPPDMAPEQIINFCYEHFRVHGWRLIVDRRLGAEFGFPELVANFEEYVRLGYTPLMGVIDYMNMLKKGTNNREDGGGNHLLLRDIYTNTCNYLKSRNCTMVTAHQLNRKASEVVRQNPLGAVKKFDIGMLADGMDPQREIDVAIYQNKEFDSTGRAFMTYMMAKHRYDTETPDKDKYFAYMFQGSLGILDDIDGIDMSTTNIHSVPFENQGEGAVATTENSRPINLFGD